MSSNANLVVLLVCMCIATVISVDQVWRYEQCPRSCNYPRSKSECQACLQGGYSDVVRGVRYWNERKFKKLEHGSWIDWDGKRCWIHLKGVKDEKDCEDVGHDIFGHNRCQGFEKVSYKTITRRCWAKFKLA